MKRLSVVIVFCALFFTACGNSVSDQVQEMTDAEVSILSDLEVTDGNVSFNKNMAPSEENEGIYMTAIPSGYIFHLASLLYYAEAESMQSTILCALPQCDHDDEDCNAYLNMFGSCVVYAGRLYYIDGLHDVLDDDEFGLYAMSYSGDQRTMVTKLDGWSAEARNSDVPFALSEDHLIYSPDGHNVYYMSLQTGECKQIYVYGGPSDMYTVYMLDGEIVSDVTPVSSIWSVWIDNDTAYFIGTVPQDEYTFHQQLYAYSFGDDEAQLIWEVPQSEVVGTWSTADVYVNGWYIDQDVLYYFLSENGVWKCDLRTGDTTALFFVETSVSGNARFDEEYVYIGTSNEILIYDYDGNQIGTIAAQSMLDLLRQEYPVYEDDLTVGVIGTDDEYVFLWCRGFGVVEQTDNPDITMRDSFQMICYVEKCAFDADTPVTALLPIN